MKFIFVLALLLSLPTVNAEHSSDPETMAKMKEFMTPGESHKRLTTMAGRWNYSSKMWEKADAKPEESKGSSVFKMTLNGRFLQQDFKGMAMGMPFSGLGFMGYDNLKKKYVSIWMDSMGTGIMHGEGTFDDASQTFNEGGEFSCPMAPGSMAKYRSEWKLVDKKNMNFTMYYKDDKTAEYKMMEILYKKK